MASAKPYTLYTAGTPNGEFIGKASLGCRLAAVAGNFNWKTLMRCYRLEGDHPHGRVGPELYSPSHQYIQG